MSKSSKKAKAKKAREKRALEQERLQTGGTAAQRRAAQQRAAMQVSKGRRQASNAYAGVAGMGAATVGQLRLFRLLNLFTIIGTLTLAAALGLAVCIPSDAWCQAVLNFAGYGGIDDAVASPQTLVEAETVYALVIGLLCLLAARWGKAWLRGDGTFRRFIALTEITGAGSIGWVVVCLFWAHVVEPISSIIVVVFFVIMATIMRLHRERGR